MLKTTLISYKYPFTKSGGEEFLKVEVESWSKNKLLSLTVVPTVLLNESVSMPDDVPLDTSVAKGRENLSKYFLSIIFNWYLWKVLFREIFKNTECNSIAKILISFKSMLKISFYYVLFDKYLKANDVDIMYSYWFNENAYALALLKDKYNFTLISRAHGMDLYRERVKYGYFPFRLQLKDHFDKFFMPTKNTVTYFQKEYDVQPEKLATAFLGVKTNTFRTLCSGEGHFNVLSCSGIRHLKQIHKTIEALAVLAKKNKHLTINWTHLGGGELQIELERQAQKVSLIYSNFNYCFMGSVDNSEVYKFYTNENVDVHILTSRNESGPLCLKEALSFGVPLIAFDVGGICEILQHSSNGYLLPLDSTDEDIADALDNVDFFKNTNTRENAYQHYKEHYQTEKNTLALQKDIISLVNSKKTPAHKSNINFF